jgi:hypothetical protein
MAKQTPNIRISSKDLQEYNRLMRNAKNKIRRLQKQGIDLMGEIELPTLSAFGSRKEFNEWKEFTEKFNKGLKREYKIRRNEEGEAILQKEIDEYEKQQKKAIENALEHYKERTTESQRLFLKPTKNLDIPDAISWEKLSRERFLRRTEWLEERADPNFITARDLLFKNNFIASVEGSFNKNDLANQAVELLHQTDPKDLLQLFKHEDFEDVFTFEIYDSEGQIIGADNNHLESMITILTAVKERGIENVLDENDFLLKNFPDKI